MPCERVDYYSEDEFQQALCAEAQAWESDCQQEPDVVPCFVCGCQMYQECHEPEGNTCVGCTDQIEAEALFYEFIENNTTDNKVIEL